MLSRIIKDRIQERYGHPVRYPKDCEGLSAHFYEVCKYNISPSTLKRIFGLVKGTDSLRPSTKDAIAAYLAFPSWEKLQEDIIGHKIKPTSTVETIEPSLLDVGQIISLSMGQNAFIKILYLGLRKFTVLEQYKSGIEIDDEIELDQIKLDYPLLLLSLKRKGIQRIGLVIGEITGVTEIKLMHKIKENKPTGTNSLATKS